MVAFSDNGTTRPLSMRKRCGAMFVLLAALICSSSGATDDSLLRAQIEKAIRSRPATQMRVEWHDGNHQVFEIFDCFNEEHSLAQIPIEKARRIWVRNFLAIDCAYTGITDPHLFRYAKPELIWRQVWKR